MNRVNPSNDCERCGRQYRTDHDSRKLQPNGVVLYQAEIDPDVCDQCGEDIVDACLAYEATPRPRERLA